jgi:ABC-2 type transport system ATP-binding protein/lipopolysaccharide transport system ATP-binding protein
LEYLDAAGGSSPVLVSGEPATFRMHYKATTAVPEAIFGLGFVHESGVTVAGPNSGTRNEVTGSVSGEGYVDFHVPTLTLQPGSFEVTTAIVHKGHVFDYAERAFELRVRGASTGESGLVRLDGAWTAASVAPDVSAVRVTRA